MTELSAEVLEQIARDPKKYLRQCYRLNAQIRVKMERMARLYQVTQQITTTIKPVSAYTGPSDKIGNCVIEITVLQDEISDEINLMLRTEKEVEGAIRELVSDSVLRSILEARYVANMSWEQIAYEFHYAYRWTLRLQQRALAAMADEAKRRIAEWENA